jgi:hypothetical protein
LALSPYGQETHVVVLVAAIGVMFRHLSRLFQLFTVNIGVIRWSGQYFSQSSRQRDKAGRPDTDAFEAMMMREETAPKGIFVSFDFTSDALTEIGRFYRRNGNMTVPLTVREILDEQVAMKLAWQLTYRPRGGIDGKCVTGPRSPCTRQISNRANARRTRARESFTRASAKCILARVACPVAVV